MEIDRPAASARARRSAFDRFVEAAYQRVSRPPFFFVCLAIVVG
jgi:low affinity Fe/Cu permease